jgi:eukaryotic-like serine/threonine-protein kinase
MAGAAQRRALQLFEQALEQPESERDAWIARHGSGDRETVAAVRRLLRADADASVFIASRPAEPASAPEPAPPERVGVYRLTGRLGRGGMGDVWRGERDDGLFEQSVAVKLMRPSLFPQASAAFFANERRVLARLHHRGIAQLFDGGVDAEGRPWFAMELLDGQPIDEGLRGASVRRSAAVLVDVSAAVQHAHQNLIVHADLKPSNIFVDAEDRPKLLDFGIAQRLTETASEADPAPVFPVTPRYASPARMAGERPVPADDIFALGVLAWELFSGRTWPEADERRTPLADADLEAIVRRATAVDVRERYPSAAAFAEDLRRWLEHRPVQARPQTASYRLSRFVRRRRWAVTAGAAALAALIVGLGLITHLYLQAREARAAAERRFADVRGMAKYMLFDVYDRLDQAPRTLPVRRDLARVGQGYLDQLAADRDAPVDVRLEAAQGLLRLAVVQGAPGRRHLGQQAEARANLTRAVALAEELAATHPERADVARLQASVDLEHAVFLTGVDGDQSAGHERLERARKALDRAEELAPGDPEARRLRVEWLIRRSGHAQWEGRYAESVRDGRRALTAAYALPESDDRVVLIARAYDAVAESLYYRGDEDGAEAPYRRQAELLSALADRHPGNPSYGHGSARADWALGSTLVGLERSADALPLLERGLRRARANLEFDPQNEEARRMLRTLGAAHAQALSGVGRHDEAVSRMRELLAERDAIRRAVGTAEAERDHAVLMGAMGETYQDAGRRGEACATYRAEVEAFEQMDARGRLTELDRAYSLRLGREGVERNCD